MNLPLAACLALRGAPPDTDTLPTGHKHTEVVGNGIYDDLDGGFAEAKKSGKPMMIVFR